MDRFWEVCSSRVLWHPHDGGGFEGKGTAAWANDRLKMSVRTSVSCWRLALVGCSLWWPGCLATSELLLKCSSVPPDAPLKVSPGWTAKQTPLSWRSLSRLWNQMSKSSCHSCLNEWTDLKQKDSLKALYWSVKLLEFTFRVLQWKRAIRQHRFSPSFT